MNCSSAGMADDPKERERLATSRPGESNVAAPPDAAGGSTPATRPDDVLEHRAATDAPAPPTDAHAMRPKKRTPVLLYLAVGLMLLLFIAAFASSGLGFSG